MGGPGCVVRTISGNLSAASAAQEAEAALSLLRLLSLPIGSWTHQCRCLSRRHTCPIVPSFTSLFEGLVGSYCHRLLNRPQPPSSCPSRPRRNHLALELRKELHRNAMRSVALQLRAVGQLSRRLAISYHSNAMRLLLRFDRQRLFFPLLNSSLRLEFWSPETLAAHEQAANAD